MQGWDGWRSKARAKWSSHLLSLPNSWAGEDRPSWQLVGPDDGSCCARLLIPYPFPPAWHQPQAQRMDPGLTPGPCTKHTTHNFARYLDPSTPVLPAPHVHTDSWSTPGPVRCLSFQMVGRGFLGRSLRLGTSEGPSLAGGPPVMGQGAQGRHGAPGPMLTSPHSRCTSVASTCASCPVFTASYSLLLMCTCDWLRHFCAPPWVCTWQQHESPLCALGNFPRGTPHPRLLFGLCGQ